MNNENQAPQDQTDQPTEPTPIVQEARAPRGIKRFLAGLVGGALALGGGNAVKNALDDRPDEPPVPASADPFDAATPPEPNEGGYDSGSPDGSGTPGGATLHEDGSMEVSSGRPTGEPLVVDTDLHTESIPAPDPSTEEPQSEPAFTPEQEASDVFQPVQDNPGAVNIGETPGIPANESGEAVQPPLPGEDTGNHQD